MTSRIYINIEADTAVEARTQMAVLLLGHPSMKGEPLDFNDSNRLPDPPAYDGEPEPTEVLDPDGNQPTDTAPAPGPTRERGQPSPGKKRRTAAEIAEDDAAAATDMPDVKTNFDVKPAISTTPEDRQDPANPEPADSPEDAAQDAADEAAETAAAKTALTLDDVRNTLSIYVKAYGIAATQEDGPLIIATVLGKDHDATAPCKVSDIPDDKIEAAIAEIKLAGKQNRFGRELQEGVAA